jgi:hypothetical protein
METDELIKVGIEYALKNERPTVGKIVAHVDHPITGELKSIKDGVGEVWTGDETYYEPYDEIFDPMVVQTAALNKKFGFPIGNSGSIM